MVRLTMIIPKKIIKSILLISKLMPIIAYFSFRDLETASLKSDVTFIRWIKNWVNLSITIKQYGTIILFYSDCFLNNRKSIKKKTNFVCCFIDFYIINCSFKHCINTYRHQKVCNVQNIQNWCAFRNKCFPFFFNYIA